MSQVQNDILHEDISRDKMINHTSIMKQKSSISIAQVDNANNSTNSWNQSPFKRRRRKFKRRRRRKNVLVSTLEIFDVRMTDGGVYTCAPSNAKNHSVIVHVVKGKYYFSNYLIPGNIIIDIYIYLKQHLKQFLIIILC